MSKEDWSAEDDTEAQVTFERAAEGELSRLKAKLKYQEKRNKLLYLRTLGRVERKRLRDKYSE